MKLKEFIDILNCEIEESKIDNWNDKEIRFHTKDRYDMEFLSVYLSKDKKYIEIDIGNEGDEPKWIKNLDHI